MTREEKIQDIVNMLTTPEYHGIDMYIDIYDLEGIPYYGIGLGRSLHTGEYGVFTGDFMFITFEQLDDDSIDLIYDRTVARQAQMDTHMNLIRKFLRDGEEHGTVVEALYEAFRAFETGEAHDIQEALSIGASEWYK